jgi:hypothetical protein
MCYFILKTVRYICRILYYRPHYGAGVYSASNKNEYQESFLEVKATGA